MQLIKETAHPHITTAHHTGIVVGAAIGSVSTTLMIAVAMTISHPAITARPASFFQALNTARTSVVTPQSQTTATQPLKGGALQTASQLKSDGGTLMSAVRSR